jgi:hypothetical protein
MVLLSDLANLLSVSMPQPIKSVLTGVLEISFETITMAALVPPTFSHPQYDLIDNDKIKRKDVPQPSSRTEHVEEEESILAEVLRYVKANMISMGFQERWVPYEEAKAKCPYYVTSGWDKSERLLIVLTNQVILFAFARA